MTPARIRVGIDVGGTFTDAVALDAQTLELIGQAKVRTTHRHAEGVAHGIIEALGTLLAEVGVGADDVSFLAHGTTQATNALLEGDVATVGLVGVGRGFEGWITRRLGSLGKIELAPGKHLPVRYAHVRSAVDASDAADAVASVRAAGADIVVGVQAFSVDDGTGEDAVVDAAHKRDLLATTTHDITKLYGLKKRARTAVVNASILPKMLETADLVERSITTAGVRAPLMVMRCDGGVMSLAEMRRRPLLTVLSGPAAGVAGALMKEKVSEGIFLETGGTSTDISVIRRGRVMVRYAKIGGHDTYLSSLDVRTVGVGGGSMVRARSGKVVDVGPRSAHIADLEYACFADPAALSGARLITVRPMADDPDDYVAIEAAGGRYAVTMTCAANALGIVPTADYAYAEPAAARLALAPLAEFLGTDVPAAARAVLAAGTAHVRKVVDALVSEYRVERETLRLVGGGGGAAAVTPYLGSEAGWDATIADHSEVISPIGVALALVRESVERIIPNPSQQDILNVRGEAEQAVIEQGAAASTVEVDVSVDAQTNTVRAIATGATELRTKDRAAKGESVAQQQSLAAASLRTAPENLELLARTPNYAVFGTESRRPGALGRLVKPKHPVRVVDTDGVVRLQSPDAHVSQTTVGEAGAALERLVATYTSFGDGGSQLPALQLLIGPRIVNLAGVTEQSQLLALARTELDARPPDEPLVSVAEVRGMTGPALSVDRNALQERCSGLLGQDDTELGAALLAEVATHENRPLSLLRGWAAAANEFGATLAASAAGSDIDRLAAEAGLSVRHRTGGVTPARLTLAQYASRPPSVVLFDDALATTEQLIDQLAWRSWFRAGCVRDVAICHEVVHRLLHGPSGAALKRHLNHVLVHCGPIVLRGHVLGADELVAHSYARVMCRLPKSPLLLTAALGAAADLLIHTGKEA